MEVMAKITLTPEQMATLTKDAREVQALLPDLDNLEKCGADCSLLRQAITDVLDRSANLREHFKPPATSMY